MPVLALSPIVVPSRAHFGGHGFLADRTRPDGWVRPLTKSKLRKYELSFTGFALTNPLQYAKHE
jgi:hypothetical protein